MTNLLPLLFFAAVAVNAYYTAKRQGRWSWPQFLVVVASLVTCPVLIVWLVMNFPGLQHRPGVTTLISVTLILLFVCVLAYVLKKFWPIRHNSTS